MDQQNIKVVIVSPGMLISSLAESVMKEKFGKGIVVLTPEESDQKGISMDQVQNIPTFKLTGPPEIPIVKDFNFKSGKDLRRERRFRERKSLKNKGK